MRLKTLYEECSLFEKRAQKVSLVDNTEPFLQHLSSLKDFDERIEFAEKHCEKKLGEGSSRSAYLLNKDFILKLALSEKGIAQNKTEAEVSKAGKPCINNVLVADSQFIWLIFRNSKKLTEERFEEIIGYPFKHVSDALYAKWNNESDKWKAHKDYEEIVKLPFFICVSESIYANDLLVGDLSKISSYRERDGQVIVADAGLSKEVFDDFYRSDSSSSSSSSSSPKTTEKS
jgi:hypothetical protein